MTAKQTVVSMRAVNDCAERAAKLATDYNLALTHDQDQRQLVFQVSNIFTSKWQHLSKENFLKLQIFLLLKTVETALFCPVTIIGAINIIVWDF